MAGTAAHGVHGRQILEEMCVILCGIRLPSRSSAMLLALLKLNNYNRTIILIVIQLVVLVLLSIETEYKTKKKRRKACAVVVHEG